MPTAGITHSFLLVATVVTVVGAGAQCALAKGRKPAISIVLSTPRQSIRVGSEVRIDVVTTNVSHHAVPHTTGPGVPGHNDLITVEVRDGRGNSVLEKEPDQSGCNGRAGCKIIRIKMGSQVMHLLAPGETFRDQIVVSDLYDLSRPGEYTIRARRPDEETKTPVISNTIRITVTP